MAPYFSAKIPGAGIIPCADCGEWEGRTLKAYEITLSQRITLCHLCADRRRKAWEKAAWGEPRWQTDPRTV